MWLIHISFICLLKCHLSETFSDHHIQNYIPRLPSGIPYFPFPALFSSIAFITIHLIIFHVLFIVFAPLGCKLNWDREFGRLIPHGIPQTS